MKPIQIKKSYTAAFHPDSGTCAVIGREISLWDLRTGQKVWKSLPLPDSSSCAFSPDGSRIVVKNTSGAMAVLSTATGEKVSGFSCPPSEEGSNPLFSPDGRAIVEGDWDGNLNLRDASTGEVLSSRTFPDEMICELLAGPDPDRFFTIHHPTATASDESPPPAYFLQWNWDLEPSDPGRVALTFPFLKRARFRDDGKRLAVLMGAPPTTLSVYDLETNTRSWTTEIAFAGAGLGIAWSGDGRHLAVTQASGAAVLDAATGSRVREYAIAFPADVQYSPNGSFLALCSWSAGSIVSLAESPLP